MTGLYDIFNKQWNGQTIWITSDTHFNDNELKAGIHRPTDEELVKIINSKVGKKDILIHLGDVGDTDFIKQLRGYKVLIMGNHDAGKSNYTPYFDEVYEGPLMIGEKLILSHEPLNFPYAMNIHGHDHNGNLKDKTHYNVCLDAHNYELLNLNQFVKGGYAHITTVHRNTIDRATHNKKYNKKT